MARDLLQSSRRKKRRRLLAKLGAWTFAAVLLFAALAALFYVPFLRIRAVSFRGLEGVDETFLRGEIMGILSQKYFALLPKDNLLFLPEKELSGLLSNLPRIESFSIARDFPSGLEIEVKERKLWAIWCQGENCFFIDKTGFVFAPAPHFSGSAVLKLYDGRGEDFFGKNILSPENLEKIKALEARLGRNFNEEVREVEIKSERLFHVVLKSGWYLILDSRTDVPKASENLALALKEIGEKRKELEYMDLRFPDKIFYRFRESGR